MHFSLNSHLHAYDYPAVERAQPLSARLACSLALLRMEVNLKLLHETRAKPQRPVDAKDYGSYLEDHSAVASSADCE